MAAASKRTRVVVLGDFHCGHVVGLTPPTWLDTPAAGASAARKAAAKTRLALWQMFADKVKALQPIDTLIVNGDCIDGRQERQGGLELLTGDRDEQAEMAAECIRFCKAPKVFLTFGTPYHTGQLEDFERQVAKEVKANPNYQPTVDLTSHLYVDVAGIVFDVKHKAPGSQVPHGRATGILRERLWNVLWDEMAVAPKAQVLVRSHVHYCMVAGVPDSFVAMTTPALQGLGSRYGARQCSGVVHWGLTWFDVARGSIPWPNVFLPTEANKLQKVQVRKG